MNLPLTPGPSPTVGRGVIARLGILAVFFFLVPATGVAQQSEDNVYWMTTVEVSSSKFSDYHAFAERELLPLLKKHGYHIVAAWQTTASEFEHTNVVMVAEFSSIAAYNQARMTLLGSMEWKTASARLEGLAKSTTTRFLSALPYANTAIGTRPIAQGVPSTPLLANSTSQPDPLSTAVPSVIKTPLDPTIVSPKTWFNSATTRVVGAPIEPESIDMNHINPANYNLEAVRVDAPPKLDGLLDDPAWQRAPAATGFRQMWPDEGRLDTERTEVRVLYDEENLYFGVMCYDKEPWKVVATEMQRDKYLDDDDTFDMTIAPYGDNGDSYYFITNPLGARRDILVGAGARSFNQYWNGTWECYAKRHDQGWSVEMAIPFRILRFEERAEQQWGINFGREVQRTHAAAFWVPVSREEGFIGIYKFAKGGRLVGLRGIKPGRALEVLPSVVAGGLGNRQTRANGERLSFNAKHDLGGNLKWGITSGLTADIAINPDFAQVEADQEVVNLSRFEFRFDEKRPFFLEGSSLFQFGRGFFFAGSPLPLFFSRRIGTQLFDGSTVRILHGEKITGKIGRADVALLNVQTQETPWTFIRSQVATLQDTTLASTGTPQITARDTLNITRTPFLESETNWNIFRLKQSFLGRSSIGLIGLMKEPEDVSNRKMAIPGFRLSRDHYNRVAGLDLNLQFNRTRHEFEVLVARSWLPGAELTRRLLPDSTALNQPGRDWAGSITHSWRNSWFNMSSTYTDIRAGFSADMGFIPRRDIRQASGSIGLSRLVRKWGIRAIGRQFGGLLSGRWITNHASSFFDRNQAESWEMNLSPGLEFENGTSANVRWRRSFERLPGQTPIAGVDFLAGRYTFDQLSGGFFTDGGKRVSGEVFYTQGRFYSANLRNLSIATQLKPARRFILVLELENNRLTRTRTVQDSLAKLSTFDERWIPRLRLNYSFTTEIFMSAFVQMNAQRQTPGGPLRVRTVVSNVLFAYTMQRGHTFVIAYNQFSDDAFDLRGRRPLRPAAQTVVAKFSYLFNI